MLVNLLFSAELLIGGGQTPPPPPPPPPPVVAPMTDSKFVAPVSISSEIVVVHQESDAGTSATPTEAVTFHTGDGIATTDQPTYNSLVAVAENGETDEEYEARLYAQYCDVKPWICEEMS